MLGAGGDDGRFADRLAGRARRGAVDRDPARRDRRLGPSPGVEQAEFQKTLIEALLHLGAMNLLHDLRRKTGPSGQNF